MMPYTSEVHDAPATPIHPRARSSTTMDQVAEAGRGTHGNSRTAATSARRKIEGITGSWILRWDVRRIRHSGPPDFDSRCAPRV